MPGTSEANETISMNVLDPSAFKHVTGKSIAEQMADWKVYFQEADNTRIPGWTMVRGRLKGLEDETPMIYFFTTCPDTIRTLPELQHDRGKKAAAMEDVDTHSEDHCGDTVRYACMSRPWVRKVVGPKPVVHVPGRLTTTTTFNDLLNAAKKRRLDQA